MKLYSILPFLIQATLWRILAWPVFKIFVCFHSTGLEHLAKIKGPVIFAPNHAHPIDVVLLPLALPLWSRFSPLYFVSHERAFYKDPAFGLGKYLYGGLIFQMLGAYAIVAGTKDYATSLMAHTLILEDGGSVVIFPEGKFSKDGTLGEAHGGVGYLAHETSLPVIPVYINGTAKVTAFSFFTFRNKISIHFGEAINVSKAPEQEASVMHYKGIAQQTMSAVARLKR